MAAPHKVTPGHHADRENIREAQTRIEVIRTFNNLVVVVVVVVPSDQPNAKNHDATLVTRCQCNFSETTFMCTGLLCLFSGKWFLFLSCWPLKQ